MRMGQWAVVVMAGLASACSLPDGNMQEGEVTAAGTDHLRCAAMISAADMLVASGNATADPLVREGGLVAGMTHLNAYAIPKGIKETDAFATVKVERDRIVASMPASFVVAQARVCVEQAQAMLKR